MSESIRAGPSPRISHPAEETPSSAPETEDSMHTDSKHNEGAVPRWIPYVVLITITVLPILLLSRLGNLSWVYTLLVVFSAAIITGALLLTIFEFRKFGTKPRART